jgi:hypothetical protein
MMPTEKEIVTRVSRGAAIDRERIDVRDHGDLLIVGIAACTEAQKRAAQVVMRRLVPSHRKWMVKRDETPAKPPAYDLKTLHHLVNHLGKASDGQLDKMFTKRIRAMDVDAMTLPEMLRFLRDLRDECVFCAGGSNFVMTLLSCMLEDYPEDDDAMAERRAELERRYGHT